jgi:hypothetical protein
LTCIVITNANPLPVPPPMIGVSEIGFDSDGNWLIELGYKNIYDSYNDADSIFICSSTGRAKLKNLKFDDFSGIMLVRNDSLLTNLDINPAGDSIQIEYYYFYEKLVYEPLVFGNYRNATLMYPKTEQSIASYFVFDSINIYNSSSKSSNVYSIDKSPTFGVENDSTGMCGTLNGKIYDLDGQLLTNSIHNFSTHGLFNFQPFSDGSYSVRAFSLKNKISQIYYSEGYNIFTAHILPIEYDMMPDSVITLDIHIQKITAVDEIKSNPISVFKVSPNPVKNLVFNYEIFIPVKSSTSYFELISSSGQRIGLFPITENTGNINLPANTTNGIYTLQLFVNNKKYGTSKIIVAGK